jgi:hypothetical protein
VANVLLDLLRSLATGMVADKAKEEVVPEVMRMYDEYTREPQQAITPGARMDDQGYPTMSSGLPAETAPYNRKGMGPVDPQTLQDMLKMAAQSQQSIAGGTPYEPVPADRVMTPEEEARQAAYNPSKPIDYTDMDQRLEGRFRQNELDREIAAENRANTYDSLRQYPDERTYPTTTSGESATTAPYEPSYDMSAMFQEIDPEKAKAENLSPDEAKKRAEAFALADRGKKDPSFFDVAGDYIKDKFGSERTWLNLASAFNTLRYQPDPTLETGIQKRLETLNASAGSLETLKALKAKGVPNETLAALAKSPELLKAVAQKVFTKGFADSPAEYQRVTMALEKAGIKPGSKEYERAMRILAKIEAPAGSFLSLDPENLAYRKLMEALGTGRGKTQAEEEAQAKTNEMLRSTWNKSLDYLGQKLTNTTTGFFSGFLPAITESQQLADQSVSMMMPLLKDMFRQAGEGVFTDKDQEVLEALIPTRGMSPGAIAEALEQVDRLVQSKLRDPRKSIEQIIAENEADAAPAVPSGQTGLPNVKLKSVKPVGQ